MEKGIFTRFFNLIVREDKGMKPILLKCGLALALTFAGFLFSHFRIKRIKPSPKGPSSGLFFSSSYISLLSTYSISTYYIIVYA